MVYPHERNVKMGGMDFSRVSLIDPECVLDIVIGPWDDLVLLIDQLEPEGMFSLR